LTPRPAPTNTTRPIARTGYRAAAPFAWIMAIATALTLAPASANAAEEDVWPTLRSELFGQKDIAEQSTLFTLEAPTRAEDAAIVPVTVRIPAGAGDIRKLTLVVDKNPAPMAASFAFGPAAGTGERLISTRLRFDMYSNLRAVVEMADGSLHMTTRFVKAAGGCSAPALKDADEALALVGKSIIKDVAALDGAPNTRLGQVMVRHPNYSGMQMNQLTGLFIPAKYVTSMHVAHGNRTVFNLEAGISLSEDPNIRFTYVADAGNPLTVTTQDSDGREFKAVSAPSGS
jgi:sulfur-oxidizing protein SoxY